MALTKAFPRMIEGASVSPKDFGAVGDGVANDRDAIKNALEAADGKVLDLGGKTYALSQTALASCPNGVTVQNGGFVCTATSQLESLIRIGTNGDVRITNVSINGDNKCAKLLFLRSEGNDGHVFVDNYVGKNALQTSTGLAACLYIAPDDAGAGDLFQSVHITNSRFQGVESTGGSQVGRGVVVNDSRNTLVTNCHFEDIGPYQDGDGIFVTSANAGETLRFTLDNCTFENCKKRSIKSQVGRTRINNVVCRRTTDFTEAAGQSEISLQRGGVVSGASCYYASGTHPPAIITAIMSDLYSPLHIKGLTIFSEDEDDELEGIVSVSQEDDIYVDNIVIEDVHINCRIQFLLTTSGEGFGTDPGLDDSFLFDDAIIRNVKAKGFLASPSTNGTTGQEVHGLVRLSRSATAYIEWRGELYDIFIGSDNTVPTFYFNTTPGGIVYLGGTITRYHNCHGFDVLNYEGTGASTFNTSTPPQHTPLIAPTDTTFVVVKQISVAEEHRRHGCKRPRRDGLF